MPSGVHLAGQGAQWLGHLDRIARRAVDDAQGVGQRGELALGMGTHVGEGG